MTPLISDQRNQRMGQAGTIFLLSVSVVLFLLTLPLAHGQAPPSIPPDVQAIMQKLSSGKAPTAAEQKRLQEWGKAQAAAYKQGGAGTTAGAVQAGAAQKTRQQSQSAQKAALISLKKACPTATGAQLPTAAPTASEYVALLKTLVKSYGAKLAPETRASIDLGIAPPNAAPEASPGASFGAVLNAAGAINEAVYASASAALKNSTDLLAANNLGVNLSEAGDHSSSALVLLYVAKMRPNSPLASVNLGWTLFNAGASASAQKAFQRAHGLSPDMSAPEAGMGLLAGCRGDTTTATKLLKSSLDKGYSKVAAMAFMQAKASQPPSQTGEDQKGQDQSGSDGNPPASSNNPEVIPDLTLHPEGERNISQIDLLKRVRDWAMQHNNELMQRYSDTLTRVAAINRRAKLDGDAIDLPRVFDRELFEFRQAIDLTFAARFRNIAPTIQEIGKVMDTNARVTVAIVGPDLQHNIDQNQQYMELIKDLTACGDNETCQARVQKQIDAKRAEMDDTLYRICMHTKQSADVIYAQSYKHWKTTWDEFRPAAADLYAFTDPILDRVWVPSLNEMLQLQRQLTVMTHYTALSGEAAALAAMSEGYRDMKCVPPSPPPTADSDDTPNLPQKQPPDCPFSKPASFGFGAVSVKLGCDDVTISGGEGFRFKASRNFKTHETTLWGGVGASAEAKVDFLGPMSPKAEATAQAGMGVKFSGDGSVSDVFVTSEFTAGVGMGGKSADISVSGEAALEGGASLSAELPGGIGGTVHH